MNRRAFIKAAVGALALLLAPGWRPHPTAARTYYVSPRGDDANDGTAPDRAWQSLSRLPNLQPGDRVRLSGTFTEEIS